MDDKRFYREGRKVMDHEKSSNGSVYCTARSNHAAEVIQRALNNWQAIGPTKTPPLNGKDYADIRRLRRLLKAAAANDKDLALIAEAVIDSAAVLGKQKDQVKQ